MFSRLVLLSLVLALSACATGPLPTEGVARELSPAEVRDAPEDALGQTVIWGGVIADARNLEERTRLEVVAYPLDDRSQRPLTTEAPIARFRVYADGYLETAEYATGRRVTVRGEVTGIERGRIDEAVYRFPVIDSQELELWPERRERDDSGFNFGFGIILGG